MANRYGNLVGSKKISEDFQTINTGFDRVQAEMDTKGTPADAQAKANAAKDAAIAAAAADLAAHKARGADEHPVAKGNAAGFMSAADKSKSDASTSAATPDTLMQRDAAGRAKVAAPAAADDIARKAETDAVQTKLDSHAADTVKHVTQAEHDKLQNIQAGAEVNQNAFSKINDVSAGSKTDTVTFVGGTGITVTTNPTTKQVTVTATGEATPGAHAPSHLPGGTDVIPDAVTGGLSGLMSGADAKFVRQDGETKTGAQAKANAAEQAANEYTDGKAAEVSAEVNQALTDANDYTDEQISVITANYIRQPGYAVTAGTATAYVATLDPVPTSLPAGFGITIVPHVASGAAPTLNVSGLGAVALKKQDGSAFAAGDLKANTPYTFRKVGSDFLADSGGGEVKINGQTTASFPYAGNISKNDPIVVTENLELKSVPYNSGNANECACSPDGLYLAVVFDISPFIAIYKRNGDTFTKLADPSGLPIDSTYDVAFSPDGNYLAVATGGTPYIIIYKRSGDVFTKLANPSVLPAFRAFGVAFSSDGLYLAVGHDTSPFITIYKRSGDVFAKLANQSTLPTGAGRKLAFGDSGNYLAISHATAPYITTYKHSGDVFTKLADPAVIPSGQGLDAKFSPDGTYLALVNNGSSSQLIIYKRNGDTFTKLADPDVAPTSGGRAVGFSPNGVYMGVAILSDPFFILYKRNGDVFSKIGNIPLPPIGRGNGISFASDNAYVFVSNAGAPYLNAYKFIKSVTKSNNLSSNLKDVSGAGYALENGSNGDIKEVMLIWG